LRSNWACKGEIETFPASSVAPGEGFLIFHSLFIGAAMFNIFLRGRKLIKRG